MGAEESELLQRFRSNYKASNEQFNRHDFDAAYANVPEDVEWRTLIEIPGAPDLMRGRAEVVAFFEEILNEWPDWWTRPTRFTEPLPALILVEFDAGGTGRTSGIRQSIHLVQTWDLRDRPLRVTEMPDLRTAQAEFGLPAPP
jgi:hypothetical protein